MTAITEAMKIWNNPQDMVKMWEHDSNKFNDELIVKEIVGNGGKLVDLGCGVGRYAKVLNYQTYLGLDQSTMMITLAKQKNPKLEFSCVDIEQFSIPEEQFNTVILIDVAHHQQDPIGFIKQVMRLWKTKRFIFTLILGDKSERLLTSQVVSYSDYQNFIKEFNIKEVHWAKYHNSWVVCEKLT